MKIPALPKPRFWIGTVLLVGLLAFGYFWTRSKPDEPPPRAAIILAGDARLKKLTGLQAGLTDLGYRNGQNLNLEIFNAANDRVLLSNLVDEAVASQPDLIIVLGGIEAEQAKQATAGSRLPVVFISVDSAVERGLVTSRERSGNNLTGIENRLNALIPRRLEMLTRMLPDARKILVYYSHNIVVSTRAAAACAQIGQTLGLEVQLVRLLTIDELGPLADKLHPGDADVIFQLSSAPIANALPDVLGPAAVRAGIPILSNENLNAPGILAAHGHSDYDMGRQGARLVDKVLRGAVPGDIPIEFPDTVGLAINLDTAERLGITIPDDVLALATEVIPANRGN